MQPTGAASIDGAATKHCLPRLNLDNKTLRDTYMTISIVVASRSWDFFATDHLLPLVLGEGGSACFHSWYYFLALLPAGAVLLAFTATPRVARRWRTTHGSASCCPGYRSAYMKLCVPAVGMAVGWSFSSVVTSCDRELDVVKAHALATFVRWLKQRLSDEADATGAAMNASVAGEPLLSESLGEEDILRQALGVMQTIFDDAAMAIAFNVLAVLILATAVRVNSIAGRGSSATTRHLALEACCAGSRSVGL